MAPSRNGKRVCVAEECAKGRAVENEVSKETGPGVLFRPGPGLWLYSKCDKRILSRVVSVSKGGLWPPMEKGRPLQQLLQTIW